jgi:hypothetical protein
VMQPYQRYIVYTEIDAEKKIASTTDRATFKKLEKGN